MKVKMILPALTEATNPLWRPIKYSQFPPLGLATLAAYMGDDADVEIQDEHGPERTYQSQVRRLAGIPPIRRDLIKPRLYLVPNSIVVSRGCPHVCDFCYKEAFFEGGRSFYTQSVDAALAEIERLPGRHLYFLDDHLIAPSAHVGRAARVRVPVGLS